MGAPEACIRPIRRSDRMTVISTGKAVLVIGVDSDPDCPVWVSFCEDPDRDDHIFRSDLAHS